MAVDSFSHSSPDALNDLDPLSRALIDLSVKRGMSDDEIAGVLGTDAETVFENRVALLRSLAEQVAPEAVDADVPELEAAVAGRLYDDPVEAFEDDQEIEEIQSPEPVAPVEPTERKRRSPLALLVPLLILVALVGGIILIASGDDSSDSPAPAAQQPADQPAESTPADDGAPEPKRVRMTALGGSNARATASLDGNRLRLRVTGLDPGTYEVWLYDSIIDARRIGRVEPNGTLRATLPANGRGFKSLDVSSEPNDGNPNHSGQSVLRVPLEKLR